MPRLKMNDIDNLFNELPNADDDKYTIELKNIVMNNNLVSNKDDLETYLTNLNSKHRFSAFYSLLIISREYNNYSDYNGYVEKFSSEFTKFKLNKIILSTYCRNKAVLGDKDEYFKAIKFAEEACELMPTNLAVKHHFAAMIVLAIEEKVNVDKNDINKDDIIDINMQDGIVKTIDWYLAHPEYLK